MDSQCFHCLSQCSTSCSFCIASELLSDGAKPEFMSNFEVCNYLSVVCSEGFCEIDGHCTDYFYDPFITPLCHQFPPVEEDIGIGRATAAQSLELIFLLRWSRDFEKEYFKSARKRLRELISELHGKEIQFPLALHLVEKWYSHNLGSHFSPTVYLSR